VGHSRFYRYSSDRGNFEIKDKLADRLFLPVFKVHDDAKVRDSDDELPIARDEHFDVEFTTGSGSPSVSSLCGWQCKKVCV